MIAKANRHFDKSQLQRLLDEQLSGAESLQIESHLAECGQCRETLQSIAGDDSWWQETIEVLSDSTALEKRDVQTAPHAEVDPSMQWIRPLLEDTDSDALGRIDQYVVSDVIGQGGMGVVVRAVDPELNRPVAIKVLSPHLAGVGAARARFMREAQAAAAIVHPSVVPIYRIDTAARLPYIVMPCIEGGNLQQRIDRDGPLELAEILRVGCQIAEGLAAAHRHGVIHRDIKPANILIERGNGRALISDFGLARALDDATVTNSGMIAGTPQYMSPEQARGEVVDFRTDLFSFGSLLYALATGRPPFRADTPLGVLRKVTETRPRPVHEINEQIPRWFHQLVSRLMHVQADRRYASAEEVAAEIRRAHAHVSNPSANTLPKSLYADRSLPRWPLAIGIALVLIAGSVWMNAGRFGIGASLNERSQRPPSFGQPTQSSGTTATTASPTPPVSEDLGSWDGREIASELQAIERDLDELSRQIDPQRSGDQEQ